MREEIKHAVIVVKQAVAHSPAAAWWVVAATYIQTVWLDWGSVTAEIISWVLGTLLAIILLANHSIALYKSIKELRNPVDNSNKQG
jgi:hypothetical protein